MSCIVLNETDGRVSNICLARRLFEGEKTSLSCDTGKKSILSKSKLKNSFKIGISAPPTTTKEVPSLLMFASSF